MAIIQAVEGEGEGEDDSCKQCVVVARSSGRDLTRARRIAVALGARILFYPTLLYNVVRNNIERDFRWWDQIDEFLILGAVPFRKHVILLKQAGVRGVVTLNEPFETLVHPSFYEENKIRHCVIPTRDYYFAPSVEDIRRAVRFIREHVLRRETTYVHCKAGRGRSTTVALCYLVEHRGMHPLEAFDYIRSIRPRVLLASSQWEAVWNYASQIRETRVVKSLVPTIPQAAAEDRICSCFEEAVMITELDLADYDEKRDERWMMLKNLGLNLGVVISYIIRIKSIEVGCKQQPVQHDISIQLTAY